VGIDKSEQNRNETPDTGGVSRQFRSLPQRRAPR
jgi:hypothetical protein